MAVTTEHFYSGNNSTTSFAYTFPYYKTSDIKVKVGGTLKTESTHYNVTGTNIVFTSGNVPPTGTNNIHIYRDTDVDTSKATFAAGSSIRATDLNNNFTQLLYHEQERTFNTLQTGDIATAEGKGQLVNVNISDTAAIAGTKISPNFGAQNIVTSGTAATGAATVTGNIAVSGTVDGRDVAADGTKLDGIEASATGDQTNAEIRAAVEAASDSNVFTDADHSKLNAIEASATADQTGAEIKSAYEGEANTNAYTDAEKTKLAGIAASANNYTYSISSDLLDEDNMASNSATKAASQQSVKAYVDSQVSDITVQDEGSSLTSAATTLNFVGSGVVASGTGTTKTITISGGGGGGAGVTTDFQYLELKAHNNTSGAFSAGSADYELVTKGTNTAVSPTQAAALIISIAGVIQESNTGTSIGSNDGFCIDGSSIHFGANLTAHPDFILYLKGAGEVTALANESVTEAKLDIHNAPSGTDKYLKYTSNGMEWATAGSGTPEGTAVLSTGESGTTKFLRIDGDGTCSWQVPPDTNTTYSVQDGQLSQNNFTDADHTKLNAIEASATADQTGAEIKTAYEAESDTNAYTDAEKTKLSGIAASANNYVHPNHSGEVTSTADGATVIASDIVDEDNLKISNAGSNGQFLQKQSGNTGGLTWATVAGTITALNNQTANRLTTIGSTTTELDGEASLTFEDTTSTGLISGKQITARGFECPATVSDDWTIAAGNNAFFPGPMTVAANKTVTVPANRTLTIV